MQLHRLTFRGLGPFRDEQTVDFADLTASGLFLLEGPTGSGKSTLIDALVFALYGGVATAAGDKGRLVSHYLDDGVEPYVELVFESTSGIYRVRRTPQYERAKVNGSGTVTRNATVNLTVLTSPDAEDGEVFSTRIGEADAEIARAVGLSKSQFIGTVVLPQGEFASFLRADVKERGDILQRIFRTDLYKRLQVQLIERRKRAKNDRDDVDEAVRNAVAALVGAAALADGLPGWDGDVADFEQLDKAVAELQQRLADEERGLLAEQAEAREVLAAAREVLKERTDRAEARHRKKDALRRQDTLDHDAPAQARRLQQVERSERAARVADAVTEHHSAETRLADAEDVVATRRAEVGGEAGNGTRAQVNRAREDRAADVVRLRPIADTEQGLAARKAALDKQTNQRAGLTGQIAELESALAEVPTILDALQQQRDQQQALAATQAALTQDRDEAKERLAAAQQLVSARAKQAKATAAKEQAAVRAATASQHLADLLQRYYAGMAAELAGDLTPGAACPVCGSTEHPAPAVPADGHVAADQVEAADSEHQTLADALASRQKNLHDIEVRVAGLEAQAAGGDVTELRAAVDRLTKQVREAEAAQAEVLRLSIEIGQTETERDADQRKARELAAEAAALDTEISAAAGQIRADQEMVDLARDGFASVGARLRRLSEEVDGLTRLAEAMDDAKVAEADLRRRVDVLNAALAREGFPTTEDAETALLADVELAVLRRQVKTYDDERAVVSGILAEPELADVDPDESIDVAGAEKAEREANDEAVDIGKRLHNTQDKRRNVSSMAAGVRTAASAREKLYAETAALIRVARLAQADHTNRLAMDLATYVLQQRFEAVVAAANDHLRQMSDGQLALEGHDEAEGRRQKAGLGLRVIDLRTDRARPTGTLSGGETFYTALSLALGLAGVVTAEAGGVDLGTLFVDEGFGSLDGNTLDDVLGVLTSLHQGGRAVGVVSHVDELKSRVSERIEVRRDGERGPSRLSVVA